MSTASSLVRYTALAVGIVGALAVGQAQAAAFQLKENSAKGLGRAFAGSTSAWGDAAVISTNPASMRLLDGRQFQADLSAVSFSAEMNDVYSARNAGLQGPGTGSPISGGNGGDAGMIAAVPAAYFYTPVGENMHFGLGLHVPFGFTTEYDADWIGRYHGIKTELKAIDLGASFSYDVNPYVSFGAQVFVQHMLLELTNAIDFGAIAFSQSGGASAQLGLVPGSADGSSKIEADNNAFGYILGTTLSPNEDTNIAISYRSKVEHDITGGKAYFDVPALAAGALQTDARQIFVDTSGKATVTMPASLTLSVTHRINDQWQVMGDVTRTAWSPAFDTVVIDYASNQPDSVLPFKYNDTTFASIGTEYQYSDTLALRAGVAYDQSPTSYATRDVKVPDISRKWLSLGFGWQASEQMEVNVGYTHLFINKPAINHPSATGNVVQGKFDVAGDILAASINYKF